MRVSRVIFKYSPFQTRGMNSEMTHLKLTPCPVEQNSKYISLKCANEKYLLHKISSIPFKYSHVVC